MRTESPLPHGRDDYTRLLLVHDDRKPPSIADGTYPDLGSPRSMGSGIGDVMIVQRGPDIIDGNASQR